MIRKQYIFGKVICGQWKTTLQMSGGVSETANGDREAHTKHFFWYKEFGEADGCFHLPWEYLGIECLNISKFPQKGIEGRNIFTFCL